MNAKSLVSILLPVYNTEEYIRECIESLIGQTYSPIEILVCDDASKDNVNAILKNYHTQKKIKLFKNLENLGISRTLNKLTGISKGEYIAIMNSDDIAHPDRIEKQVEFLLKNPENDILGGGIEILKGQKVYKNNYNIVFQKDEDIKKQMRYTPGILHMTLMAKRDVFSNISYNPHLPAAVDLDFLLKAKEQNYRFANLDTILCSYRIHRKSVGSQRRKQQLLSAYYAHKLHRERMRWGKETTDISKVNFNHTSSFFTNLFLRLSSYRREDNVITKIIRACIAPFSSVGRYCFFRKILKKYHHLKQRIP